MSGYIEKESAEIVIEKLISSLCSPFDKQDALDELNSIPAADVEPVIHAYWKKESRGQIMFPDGEAAILIERQCSNCHLWSDKEILKYYPPTPSPRCSVCGARMDGKEKEE